MPKSKKNDVARQIQTPAGRLVERLQKRGMSPEEIAFKLRVSLNSVVRWKRGVTPHPGHMASLKALVTNASAKA